jgi:EpsI family protein
MYVDFLRFDDYLLADYRQGNAAPINLYVAYYQSQRKGESAHSPRTCIPGGGWEISSIRSIDVGDPSRAEPHLPVNRVIIQKNDEKQLVFYWFQQRGRLLTNEYSVKYYLFWDAATRNRTDGALVRMTSPVLAGESESKAEARLAAFTQEVYPTLTRFIPGG